MAAAVWRVALLIAAASATPAAAEESGSWKLPAPVTIHGCNWTKQPRPSLLVHWRAPAGVPVHVYEVQVAASAAAPPFAVFTTGGTTANLTFLLSSVNYWLRIRAHAVDAPSFGPGTWGEAGPVVKCDSFSAGSGTGHEDHARSSAAVKTGAAPPPRKGSSFVTVMRESEYTSDVDYLANHNSGDLLGDVALLTTVPAPFNRSFANTTISMYCVEIMDVRIPATVTTEGNTSFADYVACNYLGNRIDPARPQCRCENFVDRWIGGQDLNESCHAAEGGPCTLDMLFMRNLSSCVCKCSTASSTYSSIYTGMEPTYYGARQRLGHWYSHPAATECEEHEVVGQTRASGLPCTWKRHGEARVFRGHQLLAAGWNYTAPGHHSPFPADPQRVHQNHAVLQRFLASLPARPWQCGGTSGASAGAEASSERPLAELVV